MNARGEPAGGLGRFPAPCEPEFVGPICLAIVLVWLLTVVAWNIAPDQRVSHSVALQFTETGRTHFRPEYDLRIYLAGLAGAVFAALGAGMCWRRRW